MNSMSYSSQFLTCRDPAYAKSAKSASALEVLRESRSWISDLEMVSQKIEYFNVKG